MNAAIHLPFVLQYASHLYGSTPPICTALSGTGDSRESFAIETPIFIARQADWHESLEFPIRANHPIRANCANRFARIAPLRYSSTFGKILGVGVTGTFLIRETKEVGRKEHCYQTTWGRSGGGIQEYSIHDSRTSAALLVLPSEQFGGEKKPINRKHTNIF